MYKKEKQLPRLLPQTQFSNIMMFLVLLQFIQTNTRKITSLYITVEGFLLHMSLHMLLQLARSAGCKLAVRKTTMKCLFSGVRADVHFQIAVARRAVVAVRIGTFQWLLPRMRAQMRRQDRFGYGRIGAAREGTLVRLLPCVRADVHLQIAVARRRVGAILVGARKATNFRFFIGTTHRRGLHCIEFGVRQYHLVATGMLVFDSCTRYVVNIEEEMGNDDQLALCCRVQCRELTHEVMVRALLRTCSRSRVC